MVNAITSDGVGTLQSRRAKKVTRHGAIAAGFIACAMVFGGGGSPNPATEVILQCAFALAALAWVWTTRSYDADVPKALLIGGATLLLLPALQILPLPPLMWQSLPSRELALDTLTLVGQQDSWRALSIAPYSTLAGVLALVPAVALMCAVSTLGGADRTLIVGAIAGVAVVGAVLGAAQLASGPEALRLYERSHRGWLTAFHANRNAAADVLVIGSLAASAWYARIDLTRSKIEQAGWIFAAVQCVLLAALVLTGSRAGIVIGVLSVTVHLAIWRPNLVDLNKGALAGGVSVIVTSLLALPLLLSDNNRIARVMQRFDARDDARIPLWQDAWDAMVAYWPTGSGIGTFTNAFQPFESLSNLDGAFVNRAHNDYMEFIMEGGVFALALLVIGAIWLLLVARKAWHASPQDRALQLFAHGTLAVIALHSIVDYPLRNMAIACLAGTAAGMLSRTPSQRPALSRRDGRDNAK